MKKTLVLVGFEESQAITIELRKRDIEAYSCDLRPCSGGYPEWHLQTDFFKALKMKKWSHIIIHPPCTFTALCGNRWYFNSKKRIAGANLCKKAWLESCKISGYVALEQPKTIMQRYIGKKSQSIQPWQFGHKLKPTRIMKTKEPKIWKMSPSPLRATLRSKTYSGIAKAISKQWF